MFLLRKLVGFARFCNYFQESNLGLVFSIFREEVPPPVLRDVEVTFYEGIMTDWGAKYIVCRKGEHR